MTGIAVAVLFTCLLAIMFRALRHASRRIDTILAEESETTPEAGVETHRKSA